jgi:hypothetical protein
MKKLIMLFIMLFVFVGFVSAAEVTVQWDANSEPDLAGYEIHWGTSPGDAQTPFDNSQDVGNVTQYTITGLVDDTTYFIAAIAYDTADPPNKSRFSNTIQYVARPGSIIIRIIDRPQGIKLIYD